eukprot:CAMPEP_0184977852 /NCGR_PEP_ID=MMETSP1098-20130426/8494_1 /TAXON_ID=89044 /ORGANISM="Spumella elongata, Strain CCAP 955/1" /LENGTH=101 /DNA_ID=CAMNT_0027500915 /DNA_START=1093 /DNA_END=1398 /DNA_ORIENTATION=+
MSGGEASEGQPQHARQEKVDIGTANIGKPAEEHNWRDIDACKIVEYEEIAHGEPDHSKHVKYVHKFRSGVNLVHHVIFSKCRKCDKQSAEQTHSGSYDNND